MVNRHTKWPGDSHLENNQYIKLRVNTTRIEHAIIEKNTITLSRSLGVNLYSLGGANFLCLLNNFFKPYNSAINFTPL